MVDSIDHHVLKEVISDFFEFSLILIENSNLKKSEFCFFLNTVTFMFIIFKTNNA